MSQAPLRYAVLLSQPEQFRLPELARALAAHKKILVPDAAFLARKSWGFAAEDVGEAEARDLCERLKEAGLEGVMLPRNLLEEPPTAAPVSGIEWTISGFQALSKSGSGESVEWGKIALLAAAGFEQIEARAVSKEPEGPGLAQKAASLGIMMLTGLPISIGGKKKGEPEKKREIFETVFYLDFFLRKPLRRFRINAQDFNYSCLKERMAYSVLSNFRTLLGDFLRSAPLAVRNRGAKMLAEGAPSATIGYESLLDLERECRWLLTLASLKEP